jgi:CRISPR/Cas system CMR-associated protein Cmr1 (group 7 of RAMP superfamily)
MIRLRLTLITPLFSAGANEAMPEIRPSSIRGHLHWWFRALGGTHKYEMEFFGGVTDNGSLVTDNGSLASKIIVRVDNIKGSPKEFNTLPHKYHHGGKTWKWAYPPGTMFDLLISDRLGDTKQKSEDFLRCLEAWLLAGSFGLRATRAAGSFRWESAHGGIEMPKTPDAYAERLVKIFARAPLRVLFLDTPFSSAEEARKCVSDTLGVDYPGHEENRIVELNFPLGRRPTQNQRRKTSPLRFRIVLLDEKYYIIAIWDGRRLVTNNQRGNFEGIVDLLVERKKRIGYLLKSALEQSHPG